MKPLVLVLIMMTAVAFLSCSNSLTSSELDNLASTTVLSKQQSMTIIDPVMDRPEELCGEPESVTLIAGQHFEAGTITIGNDAELLCVYVEAAEGWYLEETQIHIAADPMDIPQKNGNPIPGQFDYAFVHDMYATADTLCLPLSELGMEVGDSTAIAVHTALVNIEGMDTIQTQTGWGNGEPFPGNNWGMFNWYVIQECTEDPPEWPPEGEGCETAFAVGDSTFIEMGLSNARWGWASLIQWDQGETTYDLYAGAGQNDLSKGTMVGTVTVNPDMEGTTVTFDLMDGYFLDETHVYFSFDRPTTVAPGQYGNLHDPVEGEYPMTDMYMVQPGLGVYESAYLIAHGVVCAMPVQ